MDYRPITGRALAISAIAFTCFALQFGLAPASDSLTAYALSFAAAPGSDDVCEAWSLHGYRIGMIKEAALEVQIEANPRADVVAVNRGGRRITFKYANGGGGKVLFDSEDRVRVIESSRTAPWDRVVPPPKRAMAQGQPPRLFWLDDSCDVGAVATRRKGTRVTSATDFREKWQERLYLNVSFPTASSYGLYSRPNCRSDGAPCDSWCYDSWGSVGGCVAAARFLEAKWYHYLSNLRTQPWRVDQGRVAGAAASYTGGTSGGRHSSTGRSSSSGRGSSSSSSFSGRNSSPSSGSGSRSSTSSYPSGSTSGGGAVKRR